jgi:DNA-binding CsgD family transcriptional regulator
MFSSNESINNEILSEIRRTNKLLALIATQGKTQAEKIIILSQLGLAPKEISDTIGVSANVVSVTIHNAKKRKAKKN